MDAHVRFVPFAALRARKLHAKESFDVIWVTSSPYSMLWLGVLLKKILKLPLCLDLRDPWSLNFLEKRRSKVVQWINQKLEGYFFNQADRIILTCEALTAQYQVL